MGESLLPTQDKIIPYTDRLTGSLANIPEIQSAMELAIARPELLAQVLSRYIELIGRMANLTPEEKSRIENAKSKLAEHHGHTGSAAETTAAELVEEVGDENILVGLAAQAIDSNPTTDKALAALAQRMEGGHQLKADGKTPADGDTESNRVIWGHTLITDPVALLNFTVCHYLERYYSIELEGRGVEAANNKDFFLNAMIDVVAIDHFTTRQFDEIYDLWTRPKPEGLGWLIPERLESYRD